jgi:hypothetical protein
MTLLAEPPAPTSTVASPAVGRRPRGARVWLVLGSIGAVVGIVFVGMSLVGALVRDHRVINRTIDGSAVREVDIKMDGGNLSLIGDPTGTTDRVRFNVVDGLFGSNHSATVRGDRLVVHAGCRGPFGAHCSVGVTALVPDGVRLVVSSDNGAQRIRNIQGDVMLSSDNGDIHATGISGNLSLTTDNGDVDASQLTSPSVSLATDNGSALLSFGQAPSSVTTDADNGDVTVDLPTPDLAYDLHTATDNGTVSAPIKTDPTSGRRISATSDNGNITVRYAS